MASKLISRSLLVLIPIACALFTSGCAALQPTDTNGPRSSLSSYPIVANEPAGVERAMLEWQKLSQTYGLPANSSVDLQPLTGTLNTIPLNSSASVFLPKVGSNPVQSEEETRESLRRFLAEWQELIGASFGQLSLVERTRRGKGDKDCAIRAENFSLSVAGRLWQARYSVPVGP